MIDVDAVEPSEPVSFRRRYRVQLISVAVIVMIGLVIGGVFLSRPASSNSTACALYADAYNQAADTVRHSFTDDSITESDITAEVTLELPRMSDALDKSTGDVSTAMQSSVDAATVMVANLDDSEASIAFDRTTEVVQQACADDGAPIEFHATR